MKIIETIVKEVLFRKDFKALKKAFRDNLVSGGTFILKTKKIPIKRLIGVLTVYIGTSDKNISLIVPDDKLKQDILECFEGDVPCMTTRDFYTNVERYSYEGKTFIFLPVPLMLQSKIYDKAVGREFKVLFCE